MIAVLGLAVALLASDAGGEGADGCQLAADGAVFIDALGRFRAGDADALGELLASADRLGRECGRGDAAAIASFYASVGTGERAAGLAAEAELDALREEASQPEADSADGHGLLMERAMRLSLHTATLQDTPVHAHVLTLIARLRMRTLERSTGPLDDDELAGTRAMATEAARLFEEAGQLTPTLEPNWIAARGALLARDLGTAEASFLQMAEVADHVERPLWRERGLLGAIGVVRIRGSAFEAGLLLEELASFREPAACWSLAREVAVQRITSDDGAAALDWLQRYPPSEDDSEIVLAGALEEWRALVAAANLRLGRVEAAAQQLGAPAGASALLQQQSLTHLTRAAVHLGAGEPALALKVLEARAAVSRGATNEDALSRAEALTLRGRALLALGHPAGAVSVLEEALTLAIATPLEAAAAESDRLTSSASRVGEWLGLSAVETLARAYAELGRPLEAAAVIETAHAPALSRASCREQLRQLALDTSVGLVTWIVGADRTLAVFIDSTGLATAFPIELGRKDVTRGATRLRVALKGTLKNTKRRAAGGLPPKEPWRALAHEFALTLLPPEALDAIATSPAAGSLVLLPHGALERVPFEALLPDPEDPPLGIQLAISVRTQLRSPGFRAPCLEPSRDEWTGIGAPTGPWEPLPGAGKELASLAGLWPRWRSYVDAEATLAAATSALERGGALHVASHIVRLNFDSAQGEASVAPLGIALAGGATLSVDALRQLRPRLPLAVLTACGSADGAAIDGLSVRGVAQAFLDSGTRSTLVTLWPIEDRAGAQASLRLHAALLAGASPSESARRARAFLRKLGEPPSQWGAYRSLE
ncbi:MAG: CHAT domain-containing tetratricopeptide repeat protein [Planctomycetota bacterium]